MIYLLCNEGYVSTAEQAQSRDLVDDAEWLASLLHQLMPTEPEVAGLLALIRLHRARAAARFDRDGGLVLLMLLTLAPSPVTRLHRAIALRHASGPGPPWPSWTPSPARWPATTSTTPPGPTRPVW
ncbi:MAG TPA: DUF6596 domain-containing protein [Actinomycetota bacterium]|nr:DUF6596 domain-containing protein [Actinomycetota bacterium]